MTVQERSESDRGVAGGSRLAVASLLGVTVLGTVCNNVISVPLRSISTDLQASVDAGVLAVSSFVLCLSVTMPVTGWLGDRWGMRRVLQWSLLLMLAGQCAAALAPGIGLLVAARAVQGIACSAYPPIVMGMLVHLFPDRRLRLMAAWAAANGIGQAIGPPVGGLVADLVGWRAIFGLMAAASLLSLVGVVRSVPAVAGRVVPIHAAGAFTLCAGVGAILLGLVLAGVGSAGPVVVVAAVAVGVLLLAANVRLSRDRDDAFLPPRLVVETRFLRSTVAAFAQMFALGTVLVVLPLYLTGPLGLSTGVSGVLLFAMPLMMAMMAPVVGRIGGRYGPRRVLRVGLVVLAAGLVAIGVATRIGEGRGVLWAIVPLLGVCGVGISLVQTPAAAGATRSPAGARGTGLGFFSMMRFAGSTASSAWVALAYAGGPLLHVIAGALAVTLVGLAVSFAGRDPEAGRLGPADLAAGSH